MNTTAATSEPTTLTVFLPADLEQLVAEKVASGQYDSASEMIHEGLRLLKERDALREFRLAELRREIAVGIEQAERGEVAPLDGDDLKRRIRERVQAHQAAIPTK